MLPTVRCVDCPASWGLTEVPAPRFSQGHRAELNGVPVVFDARLDSFGRDLKQRGGTP
jgi:hypothetical protein